MVSSRDTMRTARRRTGAVLIYSIISLVALIGIASFAVDYGYVQLTKSEMQRTADATARGYLALYTSQGADVANTYGPTLHTTALNPVDAASPAQPTVTTTWGYWNTSTNRFVSGTHSTFPLAVQTVVTRRNARSVSNPMAKVLGWHRTGLRCTAVAVLTQAEQSQGANVPATSDLWLAGMPPGSTASADPWGNYQDNTSNAAPYQATMIPVTPGTYLKFAYVNGHASNGPSITSVPPDGNTGYVLTHDAGAENGIANLTAPINCLIGLFLDNQRPDLTAAPAARDYSSSTSRDQATYDDIQLKQPFFIGDGVTSTGQSQMFLVPAGCTRLFLGTMDGHQWHNNNGNINCNVTATLTISLRQ